VSRRRPAAQHAFRGGQRAAGSTGCAAAAAPPGSWGPPRGPAWPGWQRRTSLQRGGNLLLSLDDAGDRRPCRALDLVEHLPGDLAPAPDPSSVVPLTGIGREQSRCWMLLCARAPRSEGRCNRRRAAEATTPHGAAGGPAQQQHVDVGPMSAQGV
jgi:hypothetical protein